MTDSESVDTVSITVRAAKKMLNKQLTQLLRISMNVNEKGVSGLIKVIDDLQSKGIYTFTAFDDHSPVDLIALLPNGRTARLQVKYRTRMKNKVSERYELHASSVINGKRVPIDRSMIDGWAIYLEERKTVVYISCELVDGKCGLVIDPDKQYSLLEDLTK